MPSVKGKGNGGRRAGAGRKSKAEEMGLQSLLNKCWRGDQREACITALASRAANGDLEAIKLLMAYTFGKPVEMHEHKGEIDHVHMTVEQWNSQAKKRRKEVDDVMKAFDA